MRMYPEVSAADVAFAWMFARAFDSFVFMATSRHREQTERLVLVVYMDEEVCPRQASNPAISGRLATDLCCAWLHPIVADAVKNVNGPGGFTVSNDARGCRSAGRSDPGDSHMQRIPGVRVGRSVPHPLAKAERRTPGRRERRHVVFRQIGHRPGAAITSWCRRRQLR